nr:TPA_asm: P6 [Cucurbita betacytorhabdovirus 1]
MNTYKIEGEDNQVYHIVFMIGVLTLYILISLAIIVIKNTFPLLRMPLYLVKVIIRLFKRRRQAVKTCQEPFIENYEYHN